MTASPRWSPAGYACTSDWRQSTPAWAGRPKKGGLPKPLKRMQDIVHHAWEATVGLWSSLILIFTWIGQAAAILDNPAAQTGAIVQGPYRTFLERLSAQLTAPSGEVIRGLGEHFLKIARSYWPGLFHCYDVAGLPRTDNDLEHLFGTLRPQERRITGRKVATPGLITRGPVRVLAAVISRLQPVDPV